MNPITTSPLEAAMTVESIPGLPGNFDPNPFTPPAGYPATPPAPGQPFGQPVIPAHLTIPTPTPNDTAAFDQALAAARGHGQPASPQPVTPTPAAQPQSEPAQQASAQPDDPSVWSPPSTNRKKADQWDDLKASFAKEKASWKQREAELLAGGSDPAKLPFDRLSTHPEVAKLQKEHKEMFEDLRLIRTERDPEFVAKFNSQKEGVVKNLKFSVGGTGFEKIEKLLTEPASPYRDERIEQAMEGWKDATKARVHAAIASLDQIEFSRSAEAAQRAATFESKQIAALRETENRRAQDREAMQRAFSGQLALWQDPQQGMPFFQKTGDPKQDAAVDATTALAQQIFNGNQTPEQLARYAMWAASAQRIYQQNEALLVELQKFQQQDARFRESFPSASPGGYSALDAYRAQHTAQPGAANGFPSNWNPADPMAGSAAFEQALEAARHQDFAGRR